MLNAARRIIRSIVSAACAEPLSTEPVPAAGTRGPRTRLRVPVGGPSFLGLGDDRTRDLDYLLEDEPVRGHGRLYFALLLLVVSAGLLAWHWQRDGYPWAGYIPSSPAINAASAAGVQHRSKFCRQLRPRFQLQTLPGLRLQRRQCSQPLSESAADSAPRHRRSGPAPSATEPAPGQFGNPGRSRCRESDDDAGRRRRKMTPTPEGPRRSRCPLQLRKKITPDATQPSTRSLKMHAARAAPWRKPLLPDQPRQFQPTLLKTAW